MFRLKAILSVFILLATFRVGAQTHNFGNPDSLRALIKTLPDDSNKVTCYLRLGKIANVESKYDSALYYGTKAKELSEIISYQTGIATANQDMAVTYWYIGNYTEALNLSYEALDVFTKLNHRKGMGQVYNNMGIVYASQKNYQKALECYLITLGIKKEAGDQKAMSSTLINIGAAYDYLKEYDKAFNYYRQALELKREMKDRKGEATCLMNIGLVHQNTGNIDSAEFYFQQSLKLRREIQDKRGVASSLSTLGTMYLMNKQYAKAERYLLEADTLSEALGTLDLSASIWGQLSDLYEATKRPADALNAFRKYTRLKDSVNIEEANSNAEKLELKYEFENEKLALQKEQEKRDALAEESNKRQTLWIILISTVLLLVAAFSVFLFSRFRIIRRQKSIIEQQKVLVEEKSREVFDSIRYAKRIQYTLLAHDDFLRSHLRNYFALYQPKDIVSGDFYWATEMQGRFYLAVCDSTGHGVPGAFMSLLNISFLNEAITEKNISEPDAILNYVREKLIAHISQDGAQDGMDGTLICIDKTSGELSYAAANATPILVSQGKIVDGETDKMPVGKGEKREPFRKFKFSVEKGDMLYLYTDGFADQFGGEKGKKFKHSRLRELFGQLAEKPAEIQRNELENVFNAWKGELEQIDDVCIVGIRI